jgi:hypothetical protein
VFHAEQYRLMDRDDQTGLQRRIQTELRKLDKTLRRTTVQMRRLSKSHDRTYASASLSLQGDLDHVLISNQLDVSQSNGHDVGVFGWPEKNTDSAKKDWIKNYSDHALLRVDVEI